jgi:hypothetical protein
VGIVPVNRLLVSVSTDNKGQSPIEEGIVPVKKVYEKSR